MGNTQIVNFYRNIWNFIGKYIYDILYYNILIKVTYKMILFLTYDVKRQKYISISINEIRLFAKTRNLSKKIDSMNLEFG